ncbi:MAG: caspase family protein [Magnetococcales bacterium]|nr:caspase family protein [Magnetococcales bacterium]
MTSFQPTMAITPETMTHFHPLGYPAYRANFLVIVFILTLPAWSSAWGNEKSGLCNVAREMAVKGMERFDKQRPLALAALRRAYDICNTDPAISYNLGLAYYLDKQLPKARSTWETLYKTTKDFPPHNRLGMKIQANLAWLRFEMGDDEESHLLAFEGLKKYPGNMALAHTKYMALARMARYLEAYDWLSREHLPGSLAKEWMKDAANYLVENLWRDFRSGKHLVSLKNTIDFLIKEYPDERAFVKAKEQLLIAEIDPKGEVPPVLELPDSAWPKSGNIGERTAELDSLLLAQPVLDPWKKRQDAYALFVGIARYQNVEARHYADRDAVNMSTLLTRRGVFLPDSEHTRLLTDEQATLEAIDQGLEWLANKGKTNPNALLLFYFSGLGSPWGSEKPPVFIDGLLLPFQVDGRQINPHTTIPLYKLKNMLANLPDREIVVVLDTCFHGQGMCGTRLKKLGAMPTKEGFADTQGWAVASLRTDSGLNDPARQGAFTYELIQGLLGAKPKPDHKDTQGDHVGWITLREAFGYAQSKLKGHKSSFDGFLTGPGSIRLTRTHGEHS